MSFIQTNIICGHILASALDKLEIEIKFDSIKVNENGFILEFFSNSNISINDFKKIEKQMSKIISGANPITAIKTNKIEVEKFYDNKFLTDSLKDLDCDKLFFIKFANYQGLINNQVSVEKTNFIKKFKLFSIGGSNWKNDIKNELMIQIKGIAFTSVNEFDEFMIDYNERIERDHRKIGKDLDLFTFDILAGQGFPIWLNKGNIIRSQIQMFLANLEFKFGFEKVITPILGNVELYKKSGHYDHYQENMFPVMKVDNEELVLRPMTCPHHVLIYKKKNFSYKQLPIRLCEEAMLHRYESSGGLTGLERVREMVLEDTHIFCTKEQLSNEIKNCYELIEQAHKGLKTEIFQVDLSLHDKNNSEKFHHNPAMWEKAEKDLRNFLIENKINYVEKIGEAAFYGPKIDFQVKTALGRIITMSTIQLDFLLPGKFDLSYKNQANELETPIMIHLGIIGTYERLVSILLEQTKGILPLWLSPVQASLIPISTKDKSIMDFCNLIVKEYKGDMIRIDFDTREERLAKKIRESQINKIPYQIIIGDQEVINKTISVRSYGETETFQYTIKEFKLIIDQRIKAKN